MSYNNPHKHLMKSIQSPALPVLVIRDLESQEVEEGGSVTLRCELSKPGLHVEWKKETQVLSCGEKYRMTETGSTYELQVFDLRPGDTGGYSCCSEDTQSSASLIVTGRMEITPSSHSVFCHQVFHLIFLIHSSVACIFFHRHP